MPDQEEDTKKDEVDVKIFEILNEYVGDLPWPQRKVPYYFINPCIQPYREISKIMMDLFDNGKIKKLIIEHGTGEVVPFNASVYLHYACYVEERKDPFDASMFRSSIPKHYQMGGGYLFAGFEIALSSMKEYEVAQFLIHPDYAFGALGCPPRIPGNAPVMLVLTVTGFIDCGFVTLQKRDKPLEPCSFSEKLKIAKSHSALAKDYYKHDRIKMAFNHFREAQYSLDKEADLKSEEEERKAFLLKSFINQMMCLSHPKYLKPKKLIETADRAEKELSYLLQKNAKYHYCLGIAYTHLQDFSAAAKSFRKAQAISPFLPRLSQAVKFLHEKAGKALKDEKVMWQGAFNKLGYSSLLGKEETESEETVQTRNYVKEVLKRCLEKEKFSSLNLGYGFTKKERRILADECARLGLNYKQYVQNSRLSIEISLN
ncbi:inactive peptidyl-prolyl cis-trans isomerase FKBP6-like [Rhodnius prolixus]